MVEAALMVCACVLLLVFVLEPHVRATDAIVLEAVYCYYWLLCIYLLILSSGIDCRALSHICGRLYLWVSLFRVGLFTHIYYLFYGTSHIMPFPAYNFEVIHWCFLASSVLMFLNGEGTFKCSFIFLQRSWMSLLCTHLHIQPCCTWTSVLFCFSW